MSFIVAGLVVGFVYQILFLVRRIFCTYCFIVATADILFWVLVGTVIFYTMYYNNIYEFRAYIFLGIIIGLLLYIVVVKKSIDYICCILHRIIKKIFKIHM
jgi:spore cortex biosynthesis protein YabQ